MTKVIKAFMYHRSGSPVMVQHYTRPGQFCFEQASVRIEHKVSEQDLVTVHVGHGVSHTFVVEAVDDQTALLVRASFEREVRAAVEQARR
jgi:hypothetical protein